MEGTPDPAMLASSAKWVEILPKSGLQGDSKNQFAIAYDKPLTHLRLNIYPDGGVARLRVYGRASLDLTRAHPGSEVDLAALENGGYVPVCSDMFFGHRNNLIQPGRSTHMGDGWETKRRRGPGHDWTIVELAARGSLHRVELDTDHFKGNAPGRCMLEWCDARGADVAALTSDKVTWQQLLPETALQPHARFRWKVRGGPATHVRLNIYPDGGVARLRLFGMPGVE